MEKELSAALYDIGDGLHNLALPLAHAMVLSNLLNSTSLVSVLYQSVVERFNGFEEIKTIDVTDGALVVEEGWTLLRLERVFVLEQEEFKPRKINFYATLVRTSLTSSE